MKKIAAGKFQAQCLKVMEQVRTTRESVLITKRGQPLAKLVVAEKPSDDFMGRLEGVVPSWEMSNRRLCRGKTGKPCVDHSGPTRITLAIADSKKRSRPADASIRRSRQEDGLAISAIALWELASLVARGRIRSYGTVERSLNRLIKRVTAKPIAPEIATLAAQFPGDYPHHLADRIMGATAWLPLGPKAWRWLAERRP